MQPSHGVADGLEHPLHLVLAALVDRELELRRAEPANACRRGASVLQLDSLLEPPQRLVVRLPVDLELVRDDSLAGRVMIRPADGPAELMPLEGPCG